MVKYDKAASGFDVVEHFSTGFELQFSRQLLNEVEREYDLVNRGCLSESIRGVIHYVPWLEV